MQTWNHLHITFGKNATDVHSLLWASNAKFHVISYASGATSEDTASEHSMLFFPKSDVQVIPVSILSLVLKVCIQRVDVLYDKFGSKSSPFEGRPIRFSTSCMQWNSNIFAIFDDKCFSVYVVSICKPSAHVASDVHRLYLQ
jgi:hypothetical protein